MQTNYLNTSMNDMLFENRNKAYGAYVLRRDHNQPVLRAMLFTFSSVFLLLFANFLADKFKTGINAVEGRGVIVQTTQDIITNVKPPKPVEEKIKPKATAQAKATIANPEKIVVAENKAHVDSVPGVEDLQRFESGLTTNTTATASIGVTDGTGKGAVFEVGKTKETATSKIVDWTEVMPEFPGGQKKLMEFLAHNTIYPGREREVQMEGKAFVRFVVNEDGSITNAEVIKADSKGFARSALDVVAMLPKFNPGTQGGKPVKVRFVLPFTFRLN